MTLTQSSVRLARLSGSAQFASTPKYPGVIGRRYQVTGGDWAVEVFDERGSGKRPAGQNPANKNVVYTSSATFDTAYP